MLFRNNSIIQNLRGMAGAPNKLIEALSSSSVMLPIPDFKISICSLIFSGKFSIVIVLPSSR